MSAPVVTIKHAEWAACQAVWAAEAPELDVGGRAKQQRDVDGQYTAAALVGRWRRPVEGVEAVGGQLDRAYVVSDPKDTSGPDVSAGRGRGAEGAPPAGWRRLCRRP